MFNLGEKLRQAREDAQLEQKVVATALNLDQGKISLIEKGARKVDAEKELPKFAKLYNKPIGWFYEEIKEVPRDESLLGKFIDNYYSELSLNDVQKKKLEKIVKKSVDIYLEDIIEESKEVNHG